MQIVFEKNMRYLNRKYCLFCLTDMSIMYLKPYYGKESSDYRWLDFIAGSKWTFRFN